MMWKTEWVERVRVPAGGGRSRFRAEVCGEGTTGDNPKEVSTWEGSRGTSHKREQPVQRP